ncbi:TPM domain-containing protein [Flavobacterium sp. Fl-318]|uniref:TPM domain-containing protein n=1 Tax=Flavobacterium cupriresistens TaxID=2893885 RepID=A0ABU4R8I6_9FLAO|nr:MULTISPECIES: TPM domain-containing protein [unclassified Flavobacterium]MDX6187944.1 TPM domain-containing protein [Flavobacterium sp. Fl-318]UFH42136.1 TPM domain-containing protein [Flavobacterium sp. F-323]
MKKILILVISLVFPYVLFAQTKTQNVFSKSYNYVNDFEKILTPKQIENLNNVLKKGETKSTHKIIIVTTSSLNPYSNISDYTLDLDKYLINDLKVNASILIIMSEKLRQMRIQGVNKLHSKISDKEIEEIAANFVVPELKKGNYYKGLEDGIAQILKKIE